MSTIGLSIRIYLSGYKLSVAMSVKRYGFPESMFSSYLTLPPSLPDGSKTEALMMRVQCFFGFINKVISVFACTNAGT